MGDCAENIALFAEHKETYDALLAEGRALREEEIRMAQAFSGVSPSLATTENFRLFMRDVHHAHDELKKRLADLSVELVGQKLQDAQKRWQGVREHLNPVLHDKREEWMDPGATATLDFLFQLNEYVKYDVERVDQRLQKICDYLCSAQGAFIQGLRDRNSSISKKIDSIRKTNDDGIANASWPWKMVSVQLLHDANGQLSSLDDEQRDLSKMIDNTDKALSELIEELGKIKDELRKPVEKYEPVRSRVDDQSHLAKLINYLNDNC